MIAAGLPAAGHAETAVRTGADEARLEAAARLMAELRRESRRHARRMRAIYAPKWPQLAIANRGALSAAHEDGRLAALPHDMSPHNLRLRLSGDHPIAELDRAHQQLYLAARPEAVGCLLAVAARVRSGPLEITSLVRHRAYQRALARRNHNARARVPTHVMGLAFDISVLNAPLQALIEIRDVLRHMAGRGDLLFVAEQRQLVFHVVPTPRRRAHFAALADTRLAAPRPGIPAVEPDPLPGPAELAEAIPMAQAGLLPGDTALPNRTTGYAALFLWLVTSGLGTPPGEDLLLAGAGALAADGALAWWPLLLLAIAGVVTSDAALFWIGRSAGTSLTRRPGLVPARLLHWLDRLVSRGGCGAVALARFIPGSRAIVYLTAGARGLCPMRFVLVDVCAAAIWVPLVMMLGASLVGAWR